MDNFDFTTPTVETVSEVDKSQQMRLVDVFVLGPVMIAAAAWDRPPSWLRLVLAGIGVGTIVYNLQNYRANAGAAEARSGNAP